MSEPKLVFNVMPKTVVIVPVDDSLVDQFISDNGRGPWGNIFGKVKEVGCSVCRVQEGDIVVFNQNNLVIIGYNGSKIGFIGYEDIMMTVGLKEVQYDA